MVRTELNTFNRHSVDDSLETLLKSRKELLCKSRFTHVRKLEVVYFESSHIIFRVNPADVENVSSANLFTFACIILAETS